MTDKKDAVEEKAKTVEKDVKEDVVVVEKEDKKFDKEADRLDKFHEKHNAVSFLEPLSIFKYYLFDYEGLKSGKFSDIARRGVIVVKDQVEWYEIISKNEKLLFGFKCLKGAEINQRYRVSWNKICDASRKLDK